MSDITFPSHFTRLDKLRYISLSTLLGVVESYTPETNTTPDGITIQKILEELLHYDISLSEIAKAYQSSKRTICNFQKGKIPVDQYRVPKLIRIKGAILVLLQQRLSRLPPLEPEY